MGRSNGASKPSGAAVVSEVQAKKPFDVPRVEANFQATNEHQLNKEFAKVVQPNKKLDKSNNYQYIDVKLNQLIEGYRLEGEVPGWLDKLYENLPLDQDQLNTETYSFLKRLSEEVLAPDQHPLEALKKLIAADLQLLLDSLKLMKKYGNFKFIRSYKVLILQDKLSEIFEKFKSLLNDKSDRWIERFSNEVAIAKKVVSEFEEFLKEVGSILLKTKALFMSAIEAKRNLERFRLDLEQWDDLAKMIIDKAPKNDDIIVVKYKKSDSSEVTNSKDEL